MLLLWQVEKKGSPEANPDGKVSPSALFGEEQVQQWRAQSMHQLQELEIMNQALRSTLNLQTAAPTSGLCAISTDSQEELHSKINKHSQMLTSTNIHL